MCLVFFLPSSGTRKVNLTSWHHDKGQANLSNMTFNDGKLIVNQDGFYYLYANICFRHHETSGNLTKRGLQLMVYMTKTNLKIRRSDVLMKGGSTKYWSGNSEFHFYSVNVGGFFKLKSGEMISIQVSNPLLLDSSQEATYFGAFKVRDLDWISLVCWKLFEFSVIQKQLEDRTEYLLQPNCICISHISLKTPFFALCWLQQESHKCIEGQNYIFLLIQSYSSFTSYVSTGFSRVIMTFTLV